MRDIIEELDDWLRAPGFIKMPSEPDMNDTSAWLRLYREPVPPGLPKYAQLRDLIASAIAAGRLKAGDRLPAETELAQATGFSLGTVQKGLWALVDDGQLVRAQGSGTYVSEGHGAIDAPLHLRFVGREGEPRFLPLYPKVLSRKRVADPGPWSEWLRPVGAHLFRIDRKLSVNREFDVFNRFYFSAETFPEMATRPVTSLDGANLKQMLGASLSLPITNVEQRIGFVKFSMEVSRATSTRTGTRGMLLESGASAGRTPVYFLESYIPPNPRRLDVSTGASQAIFRR